MKNKDIVYYLGDFSFSKKDIEIIKTQLNGIKYLISGIHDYSHPVHKKKQNIDLYINNGFESVNLDYICIIKNQLIHMIHMNYTTDYNNRKYYNKYKPVDKGNWLLHGHLHNLWKIKDKMINVGVDV